MGDHSAQSRLVGGGSSFTVAATDASKALLSPLCMSAATECWLWEASSRSALRSARLAVNLIGCPINYANRLIGSSITSQSTEQPCTPTSRSPPACRPPAPSDTVTVVSERRHMQPCSHARSRPVHANDYQLSAPKPGLWGLAQSPKR